MIPPAPEGRRARRALVWLGVGLIVFNLTLWATSSLTGGAVAGPAGSSYVTTPAGTAALAGTLQRLGVQVERGRLPLTEVGVEDFGTVVVAEVAAGDYTPGELTALEEFVRSGGRLLVLGRTDLVARLLPDPPRWHARGAPSARPTGPLPGVEEVALSGFGSLSVGPADTVLFVGEGSRAVAVSRPLGEGSVVWWADPHPARNEGIGAPGAATAVISAVEPGEAVLFDEFRHGYRLEGGLFEVMPARWRLALTLGGITVLAALVAYGRRFGPPSPPDRGLGPGREEFLDAVGGLLARADALEKEQR